MKLCAKCGEEISEKRLKARPFTKVCTSCKSLADDPKVTAFSKSVAGALAEGSLSDLDELAESAREMGGLD